MSKVLSKKLRKEFKKFVKKEFRDVCINQFNNIKKNYLVNSEGVLDDRWLDYFKGFTDNKMNSVNEYDEVEIDDHFNITKTTKIEVESQIIDYDDVSEKNLGFGLCCFIITLFRKQLSDRFGIGYYILDTELDSLIKLKDGKVKNTFLKNYLNMCVNEDDVKLRFNSVVFKPKDKLVCERFRLDCKNYDIEYDINTPFKLEEDYWLDDVKMIHYEDLKYLSSFLYHYTIKQYKINSRWFLRRDKYRFLRRNDYKGFIENILVLINDDVSLYREFIDEKSKKELFDGYKKYYSLSGLKLDFNKLFNNLCRRQYVDYSDKNNVINYLSGKEFSDRKMSNDDFESL